ncbi:AmiS/UreI family transporter [Microtetraspora sp. NBRC 13810]|uniref:AmiS/UreI family transporter n=1 Tax=Microtetraspora sp. NBRC 13810 TaxID=3030990 RepID=UPI0025535E15|nr:AmiS/UreI family transporter [Microtetraspora sp. NBRC 13810]
MGSVGLLYVGAVLFINGLMLLGRVEPRAAALLNLFVGVLQMITPTVIIVSNPGNTAQILGASGLYLFAFTYLYVGINLLTGIDSTGVGYFSLFVSIMAIGYSYANFRILRDPGLGVIWLYWSFLWFLFFVLLGLKQAWITHYTGWVTAIEGWVTGAIPAFMMLTGTWVRTGVIATFLGIFGLVAFVALWQLTQAPIPVAREPEPATGDATGDARREQRHWT